MKFFLSLFVAAVLAVAIIQVVELYGQRASLSREIASLEQRSASLKEENETLGQDLKYFEEDRNLGKEFRSKFNYKDPQETMIILVPAENEQ